MSGSATLRLLPDGGSWETLGADRLRGLVAEGIEASADAWGPSTMNFALKAEAGARRPDMLAFTPIELEVDGMLCWAGYTWQRPTDANGYQVICRGWQYHADDDLLDRVYVHTRMTDYVDGRSFIGANLAARTAAWLVNTGEGQILLALPPAATAATTTSCSAILDLGPSSTAKRVVLTAKGGGAPAGWQFILRGSNDASNPTNNAEATVLANGLPTTETTYTFTYTNPQRFVELMLANVTGVSGTGAASTYVAITSVKVFRDTAYESGNASILKADQVIKDALPLAPLLNQSQALISAGTFALPSYATGGYTTLRQIATAVNAVENYRLKVGGADLRTLVFGAKPTTPSVEVGEWSGYQLDDATVSGEPIYTRAVLAGTGPDGTRLDSSRTQAGTLADRQGFVRAMQLAVNTPVTQAVADRICDLWLLEHRTAPFAGTLRLAGPAARRISPGGRVPAHEFLLMSGERVRFANRVDPDTGDWGRDGTIAGVTYRHDQRQAEVSIDDQRQRFDQVLARYAELVGG